MDSQRDIQRERLFYIDYLALFTGQVSRKDLVSRFGISEPAATKDLSLYSDLAPDVLNYDMRKKTYVLAKEKPLFPHDVDQSLFSLAGERALALDTSHAMRLPSWRNESVKRRLPLKLVATITRCIFQKVQMKAEYYSLSRGLKKRTLSPLALVNDGLRWHIRCFDHEREDFRDHNLARFTNVKCLSSSDIRLEDDHDWNNLVELELVPHPKATHPETISMDFDIVEGVKAVTLSVCLVGYFLRHWHIDHSDSASGNPRAEQLFLNNKKELLAGGVPGWTFDR